MHLQQISINFMYNRLSSCIYLQQWINQNFQFHQHLISLIVINKTLYMSLQLEISVLEKKKWRKTKRVSTIFWESIPLHLNIQSIWFYPWLKCHRAVKPLHLPTFYWYFWPSISMMLTLYYSASAWHLVWVGTSASFSVTVNISWGTRPINIPLLPPSTSHNSLGTANFHRDRSLLPWWDGVYSLFNDTL